MVLGLSDYEFQLDNTGVLLNGGSVAPFVDITKVTGLDNAPYRETIRDHEGADGGFLDAEFERGREIILDGIIYCDTTSVEPYLDELKSNYAPVRTPIPFYFKSSGVNERVIFVKPRGVRFDWELARRIGITNVQFLLYAEDPRIYDNTLNEIVIPFGGSATTGFGFSFGFDLSFGTVVPPDGTYIVNNGNRPTPAVFTIDGPVTDPRIMNDTDSKSLNFSIVLASGEFLTVDLANRTVLFNDDINRRDALVTSDWFLFNPGSTFIRFGGSSGSGTLTVSYRDAWR